MRIGLNLLYLIPGQVGGTESYAKGLLKGLSRIDRENEYIIFVNKEAVNWQIPEARNFKKIVCAVYGRNRFVRYFFEQLKLPSYLSQNRIDLVHSLGYVGPLHSPCPSVVTIHDLNYIDLKQSMPFIRRITLRCFSKQSAKRCNHIITVSQFSKERLCQVFQLDENKITVTYENSGIEANSNNDVNWSKIAQLYRVKKPYIVSFGRNEVHKNMPRLAKAFFNMINQFQLPHHLVLIGRFPSGIDLNIWTQKKGQDELIISTGYVPDNHIYPLLCNADLFVLPSLYEGFGLPVLEAQEAGVPVACSSAGSIPEVAGNAAVYFNPYSIDDITETMSQCLKDANLRKELQKMGKQNLKRFSWEKTASKTIALYQDIINKKIS